MGGSKKQLRFIRRKRCEACKGIGGEGSSCSNCDGYGQIRQQNGWMQVVTTCPVCKGRQIQITSQCEECKGGGEVGEERVVEVKIPPGVDTGNQIRIPGEGDYVNSQIPAGDLFCQVVVRPHKTFRRKGKDIQCTQEITFRDACLGTTIMVPMLNNEDGELKIPAGTQFEKSFRMKGKGVPSVSERKQRGSQYVKIHITVPGDLNDQEKKLLEQLYEKIKDRS